MIRQTRRFFCPVTPLEMELGNNPENVLLNTSFVSNSDVIAVSAPWDITACTQRSWFLQRVLCFYTLAISPSAYSQEGLDPVYSVGSNLNLTPPRLLT